MSGYVERANQYVGRYEEGENPVPAFENYHLMLSPDLKNRLKRAGSVALKQSVSLPELAAA
jgi:hypothetical protein